MDGSQMAELSAQVADPFNSFRKTVLKKRCTMKSPTREERRMELLSVQIKLLLAIHAGLSVVKGDDVHTLRQLIAKE